jgi:small subunit ribosomal protein S8e
MASTKTATQTAKQRYEDKYPHSRGSESESSFDYESESEAEPQTQTQQQLAQRPQTQQQQGPQQADDPDAKALQPFNKATPTSGPISYRRGPRGDLRRTEGNANKELQGEQKEDNGLKLRLDLNLDIEVELKASIHGDLTLALL